MDHRPALLWLMQLDEKYAELRVCNIQPRVEVRAGDSSDCALLLNAVCRITSGRPTSALAPPLHLAAKQRVVGPIDSP